MSDIINEVTSAPDTFSSWDKCIDKAYCKWPAIIGIVVGSLILLSFLACVVNCLCCGARLCSCCCGGCGSCCGSGRNRGGSKYKDDYSRMPAPAPYGGYQPAPAPMAYGHPTPNPPQFATFDEPSRKINEDSLPAMPSWDNAPKRRVEDHSAVPLQPAPNGDLEMGRLDTQPPRMRGGYNSVPHGPISPVSPHPQGEYFQNDHGMNQSYQSDLGMQRMDTHGNGGHDGFQSVPLSPPPTYRSESAAPSILSDKFAPGVASPSPADYGRQNAYQHPQTSSYAPSTLYEPPQQSYQAYGDQQHQPQQYQARPPSFLMPGRRPVNGSYREV